MTLLDGGIITMCFIEEISSLASKHKIVPFLGAGCSLKHLNVDWDGICDKMKSQVSSDKAENIDVAQDYVAVKGRAALCDLLKEHLHTDEFIDEHGYSHLFIMSLGLKLVYTTNQDNVFEKCLEKYGRKYKKIAKLEDLSESTPGDCLYVKFHGDLESDETVVFTRDDYSMRMNKSNHFLDIRLRADLLGKRLLFVGYSFRDDNIKEILSEMFNVFDNEMPESYLIAYTYSEELENICSEYNIKVINPADYSDKTSADEAYELLLSQISQKTLNKKTADASKSLFSPTIPHSQYVISKIELNNLKSSIIENISDTSCEEECIRKFRGLLDLALIPIDLEKEVLSIYIEICEKFSGKEYQSLLGVCMHLRISNPEFQVEFLAHTLVAFNKYAMIAPVSLPAAFHMPRFNNMDKRLEPIAYARALEIISKQNIKICDNFKETIVCWSRFFDLSDDFYDTVRNGIYSLYDKLCENCSMSNPFRDNFRSAFQLQKNFSFRDMMENQLPRTMKPPYED
jgi:hypothetical protein